jgi:tetratricopeptide (TPR) repeat protein
MGKRDECCATAMSRAWEIAAQVFWIAVITFGAVWLLIYKVKKSDAPVLLIIKWLITIPLIVFFILKIVPMAEKGGYGAIGAIGVTFVLGKIMVILWRDSIIGIVADPIASLYDGGKEEIEPKPYYSIAISKRKMNKPLEAIVAIREQLAKFPVDFEGVALLANIQAEDMKDLQSAEITFNNFCNSPDAPSRQVAAAWTQMADWHLKIAQDADSARAALEKIIAKFPGSTFSVAAAQRIAHLGGAEKILLAAHDRQAMSVPEGVKNIGLLDSTEFLQPVEDDPAQLAADYVKHLEQHPQDTDAREKLAVIYARHYQRLDMATLELTQLINEPNQPPKRVAHWLNLLANLQIKGGADYEAVRETLEKIVQRFPGLPAGEIAQSRLNRLKLEFKGQEETPGKKLGVYEQNIGLKYGSPYHLPRQL